MLKILFLIGVAYNFFKYRNREFIEVKVLRKYSNENISYRYYYSDLLIETDKGTFEIDFDFWGGLFDPENLFEGIEENKNYKIEVVGFIKDPIFKYKKVLSISPLI